MKEKYRYTTIKLNDKIIESKLEKVKYIKYNNMEVCEMSHQTIGNYYEISRTIAEYRDEMNEALELGSTATISELIQNYYINKNN